ncbi:MAG: hypothetical protein IJV00_09125, partial [Clostridia bacterium]|nr:hypothetical protein [Clostridia bacterium]
MQNIYSIWVDPENGDDKNLGLQPRSGDWDGPVKTLRRAVNAIGELRASGDLCPVRIVLLGDVFLDSTLVIDVPGVTIDCRSHRIAGGIALTDWEQDLLDGKKCVSCALPEKCRDFSDLWVDSRRAAAPRFPAKGYLEAARTENDVTGGSPALYDGPGWFEVKPGDLDGADISDETCVNFVHYWIDEHTPIESFDPGSGRITLKNRAVFRAGERDRASRVRYYLSGSRGDFGAENSW